MRIITGRARGVKLQTLEGIATRPTSERTKEAIFSMLQFDISGAVVLDLFAGSGQMGLEALSRGAKCAHLIDSGKPAVEIIKKNIQKTRLEQGSNVLCEDSISFLRRYSGERFDIVFLDPPYVTELIDTALAVLSERDLLSEGATVVCESDRFDILGLENSQKYDIIKTMKHGVACVSVLKLKK